MKNIELKINGIEQIIVHTALAYFVNSGQAKKMENPEAGRVSIFAYENLANHIANKIERNLECKSPDLRLVHPIKKA